MHSLHIHKVMIIVKTNNVKDSMCCKSKTVKGVLSDKFTYMVSPVLAI